MAKPYTSRELKQMLSEELRDILNALLIAYKQGGDQMVAGAQMTRKQIVAEMTAISAELKGRQI